MKQISKDYEFTLCPFAVETITVAGTAIGFTAATIINSESETARFAYGTVEGASCRYWVHGTDPTTTVGHLVDIGDIVKLKGEGEIINFKAIATTATSSKITFTLYY